MGKYAQLIIGPAGAGKTTYTHTMYTHATTALKRNVSLVNLDPANEAISVGPDNMEWAIDIKDLVTVDEVMEELQFGPNGGLIYAMEYFMKNFEWFEEQVGDYDDDYLLIDCPGQIELYGHIDVMEKFVRRMKDLGYSMCTVYLLDSVFITDPSKFLSGSLMALSSMIRLELPHVNILSKVDLLPTETREDHLEQFLESDVTELLTDLNERDSHSSKFKKLNKGLVSILDEFSLLSFLPLNIKDDDNVENLMSHIDMVLQYGEDTEINVPKNDDDDDDEEFCCDD